MEKTEIGAKVFLYPLPTTLVGANVRGKSNYLTVAFCGAMSNDPPVITVALSSRHYTTIGIVENNTFSVNLPSAEMVEKADYCGLVSGHKEDKSQLFESFYGKLENAPMIKECPLNLECKVIQTLEIGKVKVFLGEVAAAYAGQEYLTEGLPDIQKINPIIFSHHDRNYWTVGHHLGGAYNVGKALKKKKV